MTKIKRFCSAYGGWILLTIPVAIIILCFAVSAAKPLPRTIAEPPTEKEITFDMDSNRAYTADDGVIVIGEMLTPVAAKAGGVAHPTDLEPAVEAATAAVQDTVKVGGAYTLPEDVQMADGSLGLLSIPKIGLAVNVFETEDEMEAMTHGLAHFKTTSAWSGNIGLCGHNINFDLTDGYFKNLHTLKIGDSISYKTALGSRTYTVETVAEIAETDWSYLGRTEDDRITLITCISGKPTMRLVVQAVAK